MVVLMVVLAYRYVSRLATQPVLTCRVCESGLGLSNPAYLLEFLLQSSTCRREINRNHRLAFEQSNSVNFLHLMGHRIRSTLYII